MALLKLLVKNFGHDSIVVFGITANEEVAQAWESADPICRCIDVNPAASISTDALPLAERI